MKMVKMDIDKNTEGAPKTEAKSALFPTYARYPAFSGEGSW